MDFFEKVGDTISTKGKEVVDKAKDVAEVVSLKGQISTQEDIIKKNYIELGKLFYEHYSQMQDAPFSNQCQVISKAKEEIELLQEKIKDIKGI